MAKQRLDQRLFDAGLAPSREKARALIMEGLVYVNGQKLTKPGTPVSEDVVPEVRGPALRYVSRGGLKLEKALAVFPVSPKGRICVDCGASTGGFTDCLLQNGAERVYAVDVGYGQLAWSLRCDERVVVMERTNARTLNPEMFPTQPTLAVMDLSFISDRLVLPGVRSVLPEDGDILCLVKPQFEAGREKVGKKGVVRDAAVHEEVLNTFIAYSAELELYLHGLDFSPIRGPEGNIEYLAWLRKDNISFTPDVSALVRQSHDHFSSREVTP